MSKASKLVVHFHKKLYSTALNDEKRWKCKEIEFINILSIS